MACRLQSFSISLRRLRIPDIELRKYTVVTVDYINR